MSFPDEDSTGASAPKPRWRVALARFGPLFALAAIGAAAYLAGLPGQFTPQALGQRAAQLHLLAHDAPFLALALFVAAYAIGAGACLPVALMLSLTAGVVFGAWIGGAATVLGATLGAILTYLATRSAFAPSLIERARRDGRLQRLMRGFGQNAFAYVLTLRLIPFFPFSLVNIAAGLSAAPLRAFALATILGVIPTSLIYASLGAGLGSSIRSPHVLRAALHAPGVLLPLGGLALLSLVPIGVQTVRARRAVVLGR